MLPSHIKDFIYDTFTVEDVVYELDLTTPDLIEALDKAGVNLKIFEALYHDTTEASYSMFEDE